MTINKQNILALAACILAAGCGNSGKVRLSVDFSKHVRWRYSVSAVINGSISSADTQRTFTSAAACTLSGTPDAKNSTVLHASVTGVSISSNILSEAETRNLREQAQSARLSCRLADGIVVPEDSSAMPVVRIGEWDLYKDLAKTVPALPKIAIKPGFSWERIHDIPLDTKQGNATGHLFQSFSLDSVLRDDKGPATAVVSWKFTYRIEFGGRASAGLYASVPSAGSGSGRAVLDVRNKCLKRAQMHFDVPSATQGMFRISWNEDIDLGLME